MAGVMLPAVVMAQPATDTRGLPTLAPLVNQVTPALFAVADTPEKMAALDPERILSPIREGGPGPGKAKNLKEGAALARASIDQGRAKAALAGLARITNMGPRP